MRKVDIINGVAEIASALKNSEVDRHIQSLSRTDEGQFDVLDRFMHSIYEFSTTAEKFSPAALKLMGILGLESLLDRSNWTSIFLSEEKRLTFSFQASQSIRFAENFLPKISELLEDEYSFLLNEQDLENGNKSSEWALITLTLPEEKNKYSKPNRVVFVFESIQHLYGATSFIYNETPEDLALLSCDSGEDKSFVFIGKTKPIELVKEIILTMWDKIVFYRGFKMERRIKLVSKALPIFEKLTEMRERQIITKAQSEVLLLNIERGIEKIATAGVMIPEIEQRTYYNPRDLLTPPKKMVTGELTALKDPAPPKSEDVDMQKVALENTRPEFMSGINPGESGFIQSILGEKLKKSESEVVR